MTGSDIGSRADRPVRKCVRSILSRLQIRASWPLTSWESDAELAAFLVDLRASRNALLA